MSFGFLDLDASATPHAAWRKARVLWGRGRQPWSEFSSLYWLAGDLPRCHNSVMTDSHRPRVVIQTQDFDVAAEIAALRAQDGRVGAVCCFVGTVRDHTNGRSGQISSMELEHYPGMTEQAIEAMIEAAFARFDIYGARVIHRIGLLQPLDQIVLVAVTSAHRGESFAACEFLMDYLKTQAPFWKKETTPEGARWVDARVSDDAALARWGIAANNG
jgi:molybdopterin synthase catalytic subunit